MMFDLSISREELVQFFDNIGRATDKVPLTHGLHPYPAKFIPHIPRVLISAYAPPEGIVLDPMCGSGTTLVEAAVSGRPAIGVDLNPVAVLIARAKTSPLNDDQVSELLQFRDRLMSVGARPRSLDESISRAELPEFRNRDKWFEFWPAQELEHARRQIRSLSSTESATLAWAAFSSIIVSVSNQESETRWAAKSNSGSRGSALIMLGDRITRAIGMVEAYQATRPAAVNVHEANAMTLPLDDASIDFIVTSPPYANAHDYYLYNKLRLFWLERDVRPIQDAEIGSRNRHSDRKEDVDVYLAEMQSVMEESLRVLKPGSNAVFVVADAIVRGEFFRMNDRFDEIARRAGLESVDKFGFAHQRFNATFSRSFGAKAAKQTHVLVYRAPC